MVLPLLVNVLLMGSAFWWLFSRLGDWIPAMMSHVPDWLQWLSYLLWPLAVISVLLVFSYLFSTLTNLIAAPFCGLLAEQLEGSLTGKPLPDTGLLGIAKDLPRIMAREWRKLMYYLPRAAAAGAVLRARHRPDGGAGAMVPVQRLDAGDPVLRLPIRQPQGELCRHAPRLAPAQNRQSAVRRAGQPVHHDPDPQPGDPAGRRLRRHRDVGRSLPLAIRPITAAFTADSAGIFDRARISRPYHCA